MQYSAYDRTKSCPIWGTRDAMSLYRLGTTCTQVPLSRKYETPDTSDSWDSLQVWASNIYESNSTRSNNINWTPVKVSTWGRFAERDVIGFGWKCLYTYCDVGIVYKKTTRNKKDACYYFLIIVVLVRYNPDKGNAVVNLGKWTPTTPKQMPCLWNVRGHHLYAKVIRQGRLSASHSMTQCQSNVLSIVSHFPTTFPTISPTIHPNSHLLTPALYLDTATSPSSELVHELLVELGDTSYPLRTRSQKRRSEM